MVFYLSICSPEMAGPIVEMTRRSQQMENEQVPFVTISKHEKVLQLFYLNSSLLCFGHSGSGFPRFARKGAVHEQTPG